MIITSPIDLEKASDWVRNYHKMTNTTYDDFKVEHVEKFTEYVAITVAYLNKGRKIITIKYNVA